MNRFETGKSLAFLRLCGLLAAACVSGRLGAADPGTGSAGCGITWGDKVNVARGGWGRMIHLSGGDWLCVSTTFNKTNSTLQLQLAGNSARVWTPISEVREGVRFMDNGELIQLADGSILLTCRSLVEGESYRFPVFSSKDGGRSWAYLSTIDSNEGAPGTLKKRGLWEPHFYHLADGRLAVAYANEKHASETPSFSQTCSLKISASQGADWGAEIILADQPGGGALRPGMPVVARMGNGHYIAVYEVVGLGDADVCFKISKDGEHWAPGLGERIDGHHAGPWVTTLSDGRLLLTSCANTVSCSDDEGRTWHGAGVPPWPVGGGKKFTWPAIYQTAENEVAVMVSWHGVGLRLGDPGRKGGAKRETSRPESHTTRTIEGWNVRVDGRLLAPPWDGLGSRALRFLESKLSDIRAVVDAGPLEKLQRTTIVLDLNNGDLRPMQYHPNGKWLVDHGYTADLEKCVHIPVAADLATPRNIIEQPWVVLHELAHAYHDQVLGFEDPRIIQAYRAYKQSGHGDAALLYDGTRVRHYGLTDEKEFFAEMTESYFGVDDFFPFNRAELLAAEPQIHELMQEIWGSVAGRRLKPVGAVGSKATPDKP